MILLAASVTCLLSGLSLYHHNQIDIYVHCYPIRPHDPLSIWTMLPRDLFQMFLLFNVLQEYLYKVEGEDIDFVSIQLTPPLE